MKRFSVVLILVVIAAFISFPFIRCAGCGGTGKALLILKCSKCGGDGKLSIMELVLKEMGVKDAGDVQDINKDIDKGIKDIEKKVKSINNHSDA
ncbi:MAG: hypothetical protein ACM3WV_00135 [Bacillota bacterium]